MTGVLLGHCTSGPGSAEKLTPRYPPISSPGQAPVCAGRWRGLRDRRAAGMGKAKGNRRLDGERGRRDDAPRNGKRTPRSGMRRDIGAVVLLAAAAVAALALATFSSIDGALIARGMTPANLCGPVGHRAATALYGLLGCVRARPPRRHGGGGGAALPRRAPPDHRARRGRLRRPHPLRRVPRPPRPRVARRRPLPRRRRRRRGALRRSRSASSRPGAARSSSSPSRTWPSSSPPT